MLETLDYVENSWIMLTVIMLETHELCWLLLCYQLIIDFYFSCHL